MKKQETTQLARAQGALYGLAIGDALGMPTQDMSRRAIARDYPQLDTFVDAGPNQLIAPGQKAGVVTDDTEQMVIIARLLLADGTVVAEKLAVELDQWQQEMVKRGSADLLGPSTCRAIERLRQGIPVHETGLGASTNGAAMRIAPVGIVHKPGKELIDGVVAASILTHNSALALAGAGWVAGAISAGIEGASVPAALEAGEGIAHACAANGPGESDLLERCHWAAAQLQTARSAAREEILETTIGTSVEVRESIAAAYALTSVISDPFEAMVLAARAGGDTDTVAAITGAILAAVHGVQSLPVDAISTIERVNNLGLNELANSLLLLRRKECS